MIYLYINSNVPNIDTILNSLNTNITLINSCIDIDFSKPIERIGIMFKKNGRSYIPFPSKINTSSIYNNLYISPYIYCSTGFLELLKDLSNNNIFTNIDLLTCDMNEQYIINIINNLQQQYNIKLNYSLNKTGTGSDWIMESSNENIKNIYFTNNINNWNYVLDNVIIDENNKASYFNNPQNIFFDNSNNKILLLNDVLYYNTNDYAYFDISDGWTFDGNDHEIEIINNGSSIYYGLFDISSSITEINTSVENVVIKLGDNIYFNDTGKSSESVSTGGIIKSMSNNFTVSGCIFSGDVSGLFNGGICGGLCGFNNNFNIINCTISGNIINLGAAFTGSYCNIGDSTANIENCNIYGNIIDGMLINILNNICYINGSSTITNMNLIGCNIYGDLSNNIINGLINQSNYNLVSNDLISPILPPSSSLLSKMNIINCTISGDIIDANLIGGINNIGVVYDLSQAIVNITSNANMYISNCNIYGNTINKNLIDSYNNIGCVKSMIGDITGVNHYTSTMYINNCTISGQIINSSLINNLNNIGYIYDDIHLSDSINTSNMYINNCLIQSNDNYFYGICNNMCAINTISGNTDSMAELDVIDNSGNANMYITNTFITQNDISIFESDCSNIYYNNTHITMSNNDLPQISDDVINGNYNFYKDNNDYQLNNYIEDVSNNSIIPLNRIIYPHSILSNILDGSGVVLNINTTIDNINIPTSSNYVVLYLTPSNTIFTSHIGFELLLPIQGSHDVQVYYINDSGSSIIISPTNTSNDNQYYTLNNNIITIYTNHFSQFVIDYQYVPCVGHNTLVLMADGTYKKIINIRRGDLIQCMNDILPVSRVKYTKFNMDMKCNYCIIPKNTQINNTTLFEPLLITGYHPILINNKRIPVEHIKFSLKNGIYDVFLNCKSQMISKEIILCDLQFDKPTYYNANGIWIQSSSPYTKNNPLPRELYWEESYYSNKLTTDDPDFYKEPLITHHIYNVPNLKKYKHINI